MLNKLVLGSVTAAVLFSSSLLAAHTYVPNLNEELSYNKTIIKEYKETIKKLEKRNTFLEKVKKENPKLYVKKPLYEEKKDKYIYRIKLEGAKAKNLNFTIKDHMASVEMALKTERHDKNGYFSSSQNFYQQFSIPKNVKEEKIIDRVNGDYFEIIMPKK